jgi:hypothetical protein
MIIRDIQKENPVSVRDNNACYIGGITVISKNGLVKVQWINAFEGPTGFYNPRNTADVNLLRFNIYFKDTVSDAWKDPGNASHLALIPAKTDDFFLLQAAEFIASELQDHTSDGRHPAICERLSWLTPFRNEISGRATTAYSNVAV